MASTGPNTSAPHAHLARPDEQNSQPTAEQPSSTNVAQTLPPPRRSPSLLYGLASAPQAVASTGPSLTEQRARGESSLISDAIEPCRLTNELGLNEPQPREQIPRAREYSHEDASTHNNVAVPLVNAGHPQHPSSTCVASRQAVKTILKSCQEKSSNSHLPSVKVLLCGDHDEYYSAADIQRFKGVCLKCFKGVSAKNIRVYTGDGPINKELNWFFDPNDIAPGGLLILFVTGHGVMSTNGVDLKLYRSGPKFMDTIDLHTAINKIQMVLATCTSEGVISGLDQSLVMKSSKAPQIPMLPRALLKSLRSTSLVPQLDSKATVIVWAAAVNGGPAYPEDNIPGRAGRNDIMIGAICRALESSTGTISRRILFEKIQEAVIEYNTAREEKHGRRTEAQQNEARLNGKYRGPQLACLLSSPGSGKLVLDSPAFEAL